jgi:hypothetical protein
MLREVGPVPLDADASDGEVDDALAAGDLGRAAGARVSAAITITAEVTASRSRAADPGDRRPPVWSAICAEVITMPVLEPPALPLSPAAPRRPRRDPRRSRHGERAAAALLLAALVGCAPAAMPLTAEHPASPEAPTGRLAGPPPALRPGVAGAAPAASEPATPATPSPAPASPPAGHDHDHGASHEGHH